MPSTKPPQPQRQPARKPAHANAAKKSAPKTGNSLEEVEAYLAAVPEPARTTLLHVRSAIRAVLPANATEEMGYSVPAFRCFELVAGYVERKSFCSFYPMSGRVLHKHTADLQAYETTKGSIHFPLDQPLPAKLIAKLVQSRLDEIEAKRKPRGNG